MTATAVVSKHGLATASETETCGGLGTGAGTRIDLESMTQAEGKKNGRERPLLGCKI